MNALLVIGIVLLIVGFVADEPVSRLVGAVFCLAYLIRNWV